MSSDSLQHKLDRVRRPRVQITYDVETGGAMEKKELPFVVGAMADLSGQSKEPQKAIRDRKFIPIDRDNFNEVLEKAAPRLAFKVDNTLSGDGSQLPVELNFSSMEDFDPAQVAEQIPALRELLEMRGRLNELLGKMEGNDKLDELLSEILANSEQAKDLAGQLGIGASEAKAPAAAGSPKDDPSPAEGN
jgi:type VI secretion system protein ImpB